MLTSVSPSRFATDSPATPRATPRAAAARLSLQWIVLTVLAAAVYLGTTGALPLVGRDEPRYVQIGRAMLESGDWVTPRLGGFHWFEKPVLLYWMVAASFGAFGASEWAARLGPALCGLGSAALLWWMVRPLDETAARWSALVAASSAGLLVFSHGATFDIVLTFCLTLALCACWRAQIEPNAKRARRYLALFWFGVGLAFLAKGLIAFVLPALTLIFYALLRANRGKDRAHIRLGFWWGLPLALLVGALWYGPVIARNASFFQIFFIEHHFQRFTSDKFKHHQPLWFYGEILPLLLLPWTPFFLLALGKTRLRDLRVPTPQAQLRAFAWAWLLAPLAFFSLSGSKLPDYILPALPGACVIIGLCLREWARTSGRRRFVGALAALTLLGGAMLATSAAGVALAERDSVRGLFATARARGLEGVRVVGYDTTARAAQFYAARALLYGGDGEPLRLETPAQVAQLAGAEPLLVLLAPSKRAQLATPTLRVQEIARNAKTQLVLVRRAPS